MDYATADLRSFLHDADRAGKTLYVKKPVDVTRDVGTLCSQTRQPLVFENLTGFEGFRLADGLTRTREMQALALGIDGGPQAVMPGYLEMLTRGPAPTVLVDEAPIKQIVWRDKEASLARLPIPVPSEGTDFPHLGIKAEDFLTPVISGAMGVTRHPDGSHNAFYTMAKVVADRRIQFFMFPGHTAQNVAAWAERGERCPMALVTGCHPAYEFGASYTGPHPGYNEFNLISQLLGAPVPLTKAETLDLEIPALGEIVIEGFIDPNKAPYLHVSSHSDSYAPIVSSEPFFDVGAITMREQPIYRHIQPNRFTEHHSLSEFIAAPPLLKSLLDRGLPVKDIHIPIHSCANCAIIQMTANNPFEVREAMQIAMAAPLLPRLSIIVDEDVNIYDMNDVLFALSIRTNGLDDTAGFSGVRSFPEPMTTSIDSHHAVQVLPNNRWAIDATRPSLAEPERRLESVRLRARGEGKFRLEDYTDH